MRRLMFSLVLAAAGLALMAAGASRAEAGIAPQVGEPTPAPQEVTGEGLYRLYCISCHGDRMRGLTAEWIAQWPATHQNCWLAKCHGLNHPPGGFVLPRQIPALAGPGALAGFDTAAALHAFVRLTMPYQEPGRLSDSEYWAIVGYVVAQNGIEVPEEGLGVENGGHVALHPPADLEPVAGLERSLAGPGLRCHSEV